MLLGSIWESTSSLSMDYLLFNIHMGGVDSLNALESVCRIDVRGKNGIGPITSIPQIPPIPSILSISHYINTIVLKSASCKAILLRNPEAKIDFFPIYKENSCMHYLKAAKVAFQQT